MKSAIQLSGIILMIVGLNHAFSISKHSSRDWNLFKFKYGKFYADELEEKHRMKIFRYNSEKIAKHNARFDRGEVTFQLGLNKYSDMLGYEINEIRKGYNSTNSLKSHKSLRSTFITPANVQLPDEIDWRTKGAVTEVKDQGHCGSCWAFSATGGLEGQYFRKTGELLSLSEQNLIDCSGAYGDHGCRGGTMDRAFQYVYYNGGIDTEDSYPYEEHEDYCQYNPQNSQVTDTGFQDITSGDENQLKEAVATTGPISVAIDANHYTFVFYIGGIYYEPECGNQRFNLDHAVLVVGYGSSNGQDYWIIKNSWGLDWGEQGYMRMVRNKNNHCGVATVASFPLM